MLSSARTLFKTATTALFVVTLLALSAPASFALPITGTILFSGVMSTDSGDLLGATEVDLIGAIVLLASDDFAANGVTPGTAVTFLTTPLSFTPTLPTDLWTIASFTFELTGLDVEVQTADTLTVSGTGIISSTTPGLDAVPGFWRMTSQAPGLDVPGETIFSFSSSSTAIPEPSSLLLMSLGVTGLAMASGRREQGLRTRR